MPRRRKKSHCSRKPLLFTESPVNIQRNVPTPVHCAEHPTTAKALSIQDCTNLSWVSPQFNCVPRSIRGQRCARRRRHVSLMTNKGKPGCDTDSTMSRRKTKSKFKALKFVTDSTMASTVLDDIQITVNDMTDDEQSKIDVRSTDLRGDNSDGSDTESLHIEEAVNTLLQTEKGQTFVQQSCKDRDIENGSNTDFVHLDLHEVRVSTPDFCSKDKRLILRTLDENSPIHQSPPVKRLFVNPSGNDASDNDCSLPGKVHERVRRSSRIFKRLQHNLENSFRHSQEIRTAGILVPDTPEAEYGLSYRARRMRSRKKKK